MDNNFFISDSGAGFISGSVNTYADLPTPAADYTGLFYLVKQGSGGLMSWVGRYKYPAGLYTPNVSNVWEQAPFSVKVAEDAVTISNVTNWSEYIAAAFDISIGDQVIYNGIVYVNITGTQTATSPDSDTTNWRYLRPLVDYVDFNTAIGTVVSQGGRVWWNAADYTLNIATGLGPVYQVGLEAAVIVYNDTGSLISNGKPIYPVGAVSGRPSVALANASTHVKILGEVLVTTMDIPDGQIGIATMSGKVRGINTSAFSLGDTIWVGFASDGDIVNTKPEFPNYVIQLGGVTVSDPIDGELQITVKGTPEDTVVNFWNGVFRESINFTVTSDGVTVTGNLLPANGHPDMTMMFSDGLSILDTSPAATVTLVPGTDSNPQTNYIYIPKSTKVLTVSTSDWPDGTEHIKVAEVLLRSAATVQIQGAFRNQNWNDHIEDTISFQGHLSHICERIRQENSKWDSGVEGSSVIGIGGLSAIVKNTSGVVYQLHRQTFPILDTTPYTIDAVNQGSKTFTIADDGDLSSTFPIGRMISVNNSTGNDGMYTISNINYSAPNFVITVEETIPDATADGDIGDDFHVPNDFTTPYFTDWNIANIATDANGGSLLNSSCSFVLWGVMNRTGQTSHLMVNSPTGTYGRLTPDSAVNDSLNYSVYSIPKEFQGVGFLIARFTYQVTAGGVWSLYDTEDLRGSIPNTTAGGGSGGTGVTTFTGLTDTPSAYTSQGNKFVKVNNAETAVEFTSSISENVSGNIEITDNLLINTTNNAGYLNIDSDVDFKPCIFLRNTSTTAFTTAEIILESTELATDELWRVRSKKSSAGAATGISDFEIRMSDASGSNYVTYLNIAANDIIFNESQGGTGTYGDFFILNGDVGIGTSSITSGYKFDVNGDTILQGELYISDVNDFYIHGPTTGTIIIGPASASMTGDFNTIIGRNSGGAITSGFGNSLHGVASGVSLTTGAYNCAMGIDSLYSVTSGFRNIGIGINAGRYHADGVTPLQTPQNSIYIGEESRGFNEADDNTIVIGADAIGKGANTAVWGNTDITDHYFNGSIYASLQYGTAPATPPIISFENSDGVTTANPYIEMQRWSGLGTAYRGYRLRSTFDYFSIDVANNVDIGSQVFSESLAVASDGTVGIGINSPNDQLDVSGTIRVTLPATTTDDLIYFDADRDWVFKMEDQGGLSATLTLQTLTDDKFHKWKSQDGTERMRAYLSNTEDTGYFSVTHGLHIGSSVTAPTTSYKLDVKGGVRVDTSVKNYSLNIRDVDGEVSFILGAITFTNSGTATFNSEVNLASNGNTDVSVFRDSTSGNTRDFEISGYRTGDALRTLGISVGKTANDTVDFSGLSTYDFDGDIIANSRQVTRIYDYTIKTSGGTIAWTGSGPYTATMTAATHGIGQTNPYRITVTAWESDGGTGYDRIDPSNINVNSSGDIIITMPTNNDLFVSVIG